MVSALVLLVGAATCGTIAVVDGTPWCAWLAAVLTAIGAGQLLWGEWRDRRRQLRETVGWLLDLPHGVSTPVAYGEDPAAVLDRHRSEVDHLARADGRPRRDRAGAVQIAGEAQPQQFGPAPTSGKDGPASRGPATGIKGQPQERPPLHLSPSPRGAGEASA